jgi:hypothetical protein
MNHKTCDEILSQLQLSLQRCKNNKEIYTYVGSELIDITTCTNITSYKTSLIATKTTLDIKVPIIKPCVSYYIEYNVNNRYITIDKI